MNKWTELLLGLIFIIGAILIWYYSLVAWPDFWDFGTAAWEFLKGGIIWLLILIGLLFVLLGISDLRG